MNTIEDDINNKSALVNTIEDDINNKSALVNTIEDDIRSTTIANNFELINFKIYLF